MVKPGTLRGIRGRLFEFTYAVLGRNCAIHLEVWPQKSIPVFIALKQG